MVVFGNIGLTVVAVVFSVLSSLLPLGGSVVRSVATGGRVETGSDEPTLLGHRLQEKISLNLLASQSGKLCVCVCVCVGGGGGGGGEGGGCDGRKVGERNN